MADNKRYSKRELMRRRKRRRRIIRKLKRILLFICFAATVALLLIVNLKKGDDNHVNIIFKTFTEIDFAGLNDKWKLILVNRDNPLPYDWNIETVELSNGELVDARIYPDLQKMFDDMRSDGVYPEVVSGYRTSEKQQQLMDEKIQEYNSAGYSPDEAKQKAEEWVAIPGTSEHQLGIAVDINADGVNSFGYEVYDWLDQNAYKYGFIKRYPEDKTEITGIINEPWHYRYVGYDAALEMTERSLCLEEYLEAIE